MKRARLESPGTNKKTTAEKKERHQLLSLPPVGADDVNDSSEHRIGNTPKKTNWKDVFFFLCGSFLSACAASTKDVNGRS